MNSEKILKNWKKGKLNSEMIWKIWKTSVLVIITPKETNSSPPSLFLLLLPSLLPTILLHLPPDLLPTILLLLLLLPLCMYIHCFSELRRIILE